MKLKLVRLVCYIVAFLLNVNVGFSDNPSKILTISSGTSLGNYFKVANIFCRLVNLNNTDADVIKCVSRSTNGTVDNINIVMQDKTTVGIGQTDVITKSSQADKLNFIAKLYVEPVFIVSSKTSDAKNFNDVILQDNINIGSPKAGENATAKMLINAKNWKKANTTEYSRYEIMSLICSNRVNISFFVTANPSDFIFDIIKKCNARIIPFTQDFIDLFTSTNKGFEKFIIASNTYPNQDTQINTIAIETILFAHEDTSEKMVQALLKSIFSDLETLQNSNPAFANRSIKSFFVNNTSLKMHNGAKIFLQNTETKQN